MASDDQIAATCLSVALHHAQNHSGCGGWWSGPYRGRSAPAQSNGLVGILPAAGVLFADVLPAASLCGGAACTSRFCQHLILSTPQLQQDGRPLGLTDGRQSHSSRRFQNSVAIKIIISQSSALAIGTSSTGTQH